MSPVFCLRRGGFGRTAQVFGWTTCFLFFIYVYLLIKTPYSETRNVIGNDPGSSMPDVSKWKSLMYHAVKPFMPSATVNASTAHDVPVIPRNLTIAQLRKVDAETLNRSKDSSLIGYPHEICGCGKYTPPDRGSHQTNLKNMFSTCSHEATLYGTGQKVRSYTLFINHQAYIPEFVLPIEQNLKANAQLFPGWVTRIYSDISIANPLVCGLICKYPDLFWCDIRNIPRYGDLSSMNGRTWRFLSLGDPTVDIFLSRDMDGPVFERERAAVAEWESSVIPFHSMRDNPQMRTPVQAGMWGAKNFMLGPLFGQFLQRTLISAAIENQVSHALDEDILKKYLYTPYASLMFLLHASYHCNAYNEFKKLPFPTQRIGNQTVGVSQFTQTYTVPPCPVECRPAFAKHWKFC